MVSASRIPKLLIVTGLDTVSPRTDDFTSDTQIDKFRRTLRLRNHSEQNPILSRSSLQSMALLTPPFPPSGRYVEYVRESSRALTQAEAVTVSVHIRATVPISAIVYLWVPLYWR